MLIGFVAEQPDEYMALADGLRAAGHVLRLLPGAIDGPLDIAEMQAVIVASAYCPPEIQRYSEMDPQRCTLALITPEELGSLAAGSPFTDFVVAPHRAAEVAARLALHSNRQKANDSEVIRSGDLVIDVSNYSVEAHGERVALTFKEYELLKFLVTHSGRVFSRESLLEQVWGYDYWGGSRTIDVHIRRIRSKLPAATASRIETVHQVGYRYSVAKGEQPGAS
ncbi:MAG TPA: winged helix-turn-helix domain-containing protein [Armatimonadota bacterium]|jgi:DNA-binding winged helix-turn-helix (wHTH) protein